MEAELHQSDSSSSSSSEGKTFADAEVQCNIIPGEPVSIETVDGEQSGIAYIQHHSSLLVSAFIEQATGTGPSQEDRDLFFHEVCDALEIFRVTSDSIREFQAITRFEVSRLIADTVNRRIDATRHIWRTLDRLRAHEEWRITRAQAP